MLDILKLYIKNIPGWRSARRLVVFISDDWGDNRIRSERDYLRLISMGIPVDKSVHTKYGALATHSDLYSLYEVLTRYRDRNGRNAVITPFVIMTNPDFDRIKAGGFEKYYYEVFTDTIRKSVGGDETIKAWHNGIEEGIFLPELHGREHFNVPQWLKYLRKGDKRLLEAFELQYAYLKTDEMNVSPVYAFYFDNKIDFEFLNESLADGVRIFQETFGRKPSVFNPPNGMFHTAFYPQLAESGIKAVNTRHFRPQPGSKGRIMKNHFRSGQVSSEGILHFISNCAFEPAAWDYGGTGKTLRQVEVAFNCRKPALINTHRVNYIGSRDRKVRDKSLSELDHLLKSLISKWPDIEFVSAGEFVSIMARRQ
ncbi:MAG: hypothetical protein WAW07_10980 [Bacteroidales bacterium]